MDKFPKKVSNWCKMVPPAFGFGQVSKQFSSVRLYITANRLSS